MQAVGRATSSDGVVTIVAERKRLTLILKVESVTSWIGRASRNQKQQNHKRHALANAPAEFNDSWIAQDEE